MMMVTLQDRIMIDGFYLGLLYLLYTLNNDGLSATPAYSHINTPEELIIYSNMKLLTVQHLSHCVAR